MSQGRFVLQRSAHASIPVWAAGGIRNCPNCQYDKSVQRGTLASSDFYRHHADWSLRDNGCTCSLPPRGFNIRFLSPSGWVEGFIHANDVTFSPLHTVATSVLTVGLATHPPFGVREYVIQNRPAKRVTRWGVSLPDLPVGMRLLSGADHMGASTQFHDYWWIEQICAYGPSGIWMPADGDINGDGAFIETGIRTSRRPHGILIQTSAAT